MSLNSTSPKTNSKIEPINCFDEEFLNSKDLALRPINIFFETESILEELPSKTKHLSLKKEKKIKKERKSDKSLRSENSKKSTSNNECKKSGRKKSVTQIYSSNIVIIHNDDNEDCSSTDPIEKELEKLKKLMAKNKNKKKQKKEKNI